MYQKSIIFFGVFFCSLNVLAEEWITEEVLKQLTEIRQELKGVKAELRELKEAVNKQGNKPSAQVPTNRADKELAISNTPFLGDDNAQVVIVEFSDYQCPFCRRHFKQTFPDIKKNYIDANKVQYHVKQFPLGFHAKAKDASIAALCAEQQKEGLYWQVHESIFNGETKLARDSYTALAEQLKLDEGKYEECLDNKQIADRVDREFLEGESVGVSGTPAFIVGKLQGDKVVEAQLISGARPYASFSRVIDQLLN